MPVDRVRGPPTPEAAQRRLDEGTGVRRAPRQSGRRRRAGGRHVIPVDARDLGLPDGRRRADAAPYAAIARLRRCPRPGRARLQRGPERSLRRARRRQRTRQRRAREPQVRRRSPGRQPEAGRRPRPQRMRRRDGRRRHLPRSGGIPVHRARSTMMRSLLDRLLVVRALGREADGGDLGSRRDAARRLPRRADRSVGGLERGARGAYGAAGVEP